MKAIKNESQASLGQNPQHATRPTKVPRFSFAKGVIFAALLCSFHLPLAAATYYVSKTGSDSNAGTQAAPWLTVQKAANTLVAGDTVLIGSGTYAERVTETTSGTSSAHITYSAQGAVTIGGFLIRGAYVDGSGFTFSGSGISVGEGVLEFGAGGNYCTWSHCSYTETASAATGPKGIVMTLYAPYVTGCTLDDIDITNSHGIPVSLVGSGHTLKNCTISNSNCWDLINFFGNNITIQDNDLTCTNPNGYENHADFFQTFNATSNQQTNNVIIERNICRGSGSDDVQLGNIEDSDENSNVTGIVWRNNIFINISRTINLAAPGCAFYNNTFYRCSKMSGGYVITLYSNFQGHANNTTIKNNIFFECGVSTNPAWGWYGGDSVTGTSADYNLVVGTGAGTTKTGFVEAHGINGKNPLFTNAASNDFSLQATSPAKDTGVAISGFNTDYSRNSRTGSWDIGAFENSSSTSVIAPENATTAISVQ